MLLFSFEKEKKILEPESEYEFPVYIRLDCYKSKFYSQLEGILLVCRYTLDDEYKTFLFS